MFYNLKLKNRILLGYLLPIAFFLSLGCILYIGAIKREEILEKTKISQNNIISAEGLRNGLSQMVRNIRGRVLFPLDDGYEKGYETGFKLFHEKAAELDKTIQNPEQRQNFSILMTEVDRLDEISRKVLELVKKSDLKYATTLTASLRMNEIDRAQEQLLTKEQEFLIRASQEEQKETRWLLTLIVVGTGLSALGSLSIGLWVSSDIARMMNQAADAIASSSVEIVAAVEQQERSASKQATAVNQTTITMDELGASSQATVQQAEFAAAGARQALTLTEEGTEVVERTLEGMATLKDKVGAIAEQILHLSEQTNQIGTISSLVREFANQTNMLALNAAVEAVRAGDRGKGFAVIAAEIRQLADRSKMSAAKINSLVADIQEAINSTVKATDEGTVTVDAGMQLTQGTAAAFSGVSEAIHSIAVSTQQISLTAEQQAIAVQQVIEAMKTLNQGAEETANGISITKVGTKNLNEAAHNLKVVL